MRDFAIVHKAGKSGTSIPRKGSYFIGALYLFVGVSTSTILFAAPLKALDLGASEVVVGGLVSSFASTGLILSFTGAAMCNRFGERAMIAVAFASYILGQVVAALARSPECLLLAAAAAGVGDMLFTIGGMMYLTQTANNQGKELLISAALSLLRCGSVLGSAVAGRMAEAFGYPSVFLIGGLISMGGITVALGLPKRDVSLPAGRFDYWSSLAAYRSGLRLLRDNPMVRLVAILTVLSTVGWFTFTSSFYLNHLRLVGMTKATMGLVVAVGSAATVVAPFVYSLLTRCAPPVGIILSGSLCAGLGLAMSPFLFKPLSLGLVAVLARTGDTLRMPGVFSLLGMHTDPDDRPISMAIVNTSWAVAALCAGPVWGLLAGVVGLSATFLAAGFGTMVAAGILWKLDRSADYAGQNQRADH